MQLNDLILISVDDHIVEPPGLFDDHIASAYYDRRPVVRRDETGVDYWDIAGRRIPYTGLGAVAGRPPEEYNVEPDSFEDMRRGCYDVDARVGDMNVNGVLASLNFPSFPQFCGQLFMKLGDHDLGLALVRAYNDWHVHSWAGAHPGRFIPCGILPLWDASLMAEEVRRLTALGCHAVTFSENPSYLDLPSFQSEAWDPFWAACSDVGTVVCLHIGSSSKVITTSDDAPVDTGIALLTMNTMICLADLLFSPVPRRFPDLKIALSEGGIGWIPYVLERADYVYAHHHAWTGQDFGTKQPSDIFREHFITCFISDRIGIGLRHEIGIDNITWESDYPHSDSVRPSAPEVLAVQLAGLSDQEVNKITHKNAMRTYAFDPFAHIPKDQATVGALRA